MNDQEKHNATKKKLKILGFCLLAIGGIFTVIGFISFFSAFGGNGAPRFFWCAFIGLPMLAGGAMVTTLAYKQEISRFVKNESVPVINEASEEIAPAIRNVASAVKDGIDGENENFCPACGASNNEENSFCGKCGKALKKTCPKCGKSAPADNAFCGNCGEKL